MLLALAALLAIAWVLGFAVFSVGSGLIHVLVIAAAIVMVLHFVRGARTGRTVM